MGFGGRRKSKSRIQRNALAGVRYFRRSMECLPEYEESDFSVIGSVVAKVANG